MKKVKEIFNVKYGINLELINCTIVDFTRGIPFVSRISKNNGVVAYVEKIESLQPNPRHTISVAGSGSVLSCFYQGEPYYSGRDLFYLLPKIELSIKEMLYYCYAINSNAYKYNYGRQANKTLGEILIPDVENIPEWVHKIKIPSKPKTNPINNTHIELDTKKWKTFKYSDVFNIEKGYYNKKPRENKYGDIRFIGASQYKNGVTSIHAKKDVEKIFDGNNITVANDGNSVASAFYQPTQFTCSHSVNVLTLKDKTIKMTVYIALFICALIRREKYRFGYGRKWRYERMMVSEIRLPIAKDKKTDFDFMENYIKSLPYSKTL